MFVREEGLKHIGVSSTVTQGEGFTMLGTCGATDWAVGCGTYSSQGFWTFFPGEIITVVMSPNPYTSLQLS